MSTAATLSSALAGAHGAGPSNSARDAQLAPGDIAVGVVIGRASEYFDFFVYGIASVLVFPAVFFPFADRLEGLLFAFAMFAVAFIVRPVGTLAGMSLQRRFGRGTKLTVALFLLGTCTVSIALVPSFHTAGALAIAMLFVARVGQGLALGASWDGLPSLLALNVKPQRRGWYAMLGQLGAPVGLVVACGLFSFLWANLGEADFHTWGWRYPFFAAFAINVVALFARLRLVVTHEYERELESRYLEPCDTHQLLVEQGGNVVIGAFAALASYALFHLVTIFPLSWAFLHSPAKIGSVLSVEIAGALLAALSMPISGWISDRIGRRSMLGTVALVIGLFSLLAPWLLDGSPYGVEVFVLVGCTLLGLSYAQASGSVSSNFHPRFRYTGAALTTDLAWMVGAAFAPLVVLALSTRLGLAAVSVYLLSAVLWTLLALRANHLLNRRR